ncbi:MAG TPA: hypothetical protein VFW59_02575 [Gallionella sp.]|nr:hypothetical protein [Gallionella sp.]
MLTGAMLGLMEQLGLDILTLTEALDEAEFFTSRLTRAQTLKILGSMARTAAELPAGTREILPLIDWGAWAVLNKALANPSQHPLLIWVAIKELTPVTVQQLADYKRTQPQLFAMVI